MEVKKYRVNPLVVMEVLLLLPFPRCEKMMMTMVQVVMVVHCWMNPGLMDFSNLVDLD